MKASDFRNFLKPKIPQAPQAPPVWTNPYRSRIRIPTHPANNGNANHSIQGINPLAQAATNIHQGTMNTFKKQLGHLAEPISSVNPKLAKLLSDLTSTNSKGIPVTGVADKNYLGTNNINLEYQRAIHDKVKEIDDDIETIGKRNPQKDTPEYQKLMKLIYGRNIVDWNKKYTVVKPATVESGGQFELLVPFKIQHQQSRRSY